MTGGRKTTWVFGYGSLIWNTGAVRPVERREGILPGWHREWTWISNSSAPVGGDDAPTTLRWRHAILGAVPSNVTGKQKLPPRP